MEEHLRSRKAFGTHWTDVRLFLGMRPHVTDEMVGSIVVPLAGATLEETVGANLGARGRLGLLVGGIGEAHESAPAVGGLHGPPPSAAFEVDVDGSCAVPVGGAAL